VTDSDTLKGLVEVNASLKRLVEAVQKKFLLPANLARPSETRNRDSGNARAFSPSLDDALERIAGPPVGTQWAEPQPEAPRAKRQRPPLRKAIFEFVKDQWPDGNIPRTAKVRRRIAESEVWKCIAAKHGISTKKTPDWHTVNRALDREV
jgi:hypothetical protein